MHALRGSGPGKQHCHICGGSRACVLGRQHVGLRVPGQARPPVRLWLLAGPSLSNTVTRPCGQRHDPRDGVHIRQPRGRKNQQLNIQVPSPPMLPPLGRADATSQSTAAPAGGGLAPIAQEHQLLSIHIRQKTHIKSYSKQKEACRTSHNFILYACKESWTTGTK